MVFELYFEELIKINGLEIIKHVTELPEIAGFDDNIDYSEILNSYNLTYQKDSPVRNSIFFIDSIPEIKEITSSVL